MFADPFAKSFPHRFRKEHAVATDISPDFELVQRIAAADERALHELYATYGQRLYSYALRLTCDPAQAEDVVQDALVVVWRSAGKYRREGRLLAWLLGIIHHIAIKSLRHRSYPISEEIEERLPAAGPMPEEQVQANEQTDWVRRCLSELSPEHRAVLELVFYQDLSFQETAQVCGVPLGTVKSRLNHARKQLRGLVSRMEEHQ